MRLLILRHGQAEPLLGGGLDDDAARALTEHGRAQVARVCELCADELAKVRAIWASPFVRTQQTAAIVAQRLELLVATEPLLVGDTPPQRLLDALQWAEREPGSWPLLLVSHQPLVGGLVNGLCGSGNEYPMATSSLASLSAEVWAKGCAELEWLQHAG